MSKKIIAPQSIFKYFDILKNETNKQYILAGEAKKKGFDPEKEVGIILADSVSKRVEGLISAEAPQIINSGVAERIDSLEKKYPSGDWRIGMIIAAEVAQQKFCKFKDLEEAVSIGIRTGLAYTTNGVVSAPLEGIADIKLRLRKDNKKYISLFFAGPIRGAGATQQIVSLVISDYVRVKMNIDKYDPDEDEINRYYTEVIDYYERVERKQYKPTFEEIKMIVSSIPIEINGDPSSKLEVSNYKNLPRIDTNKIRGGMALVLTDGVIKLPKVWRQLKKWQEDFNIDWSWLPKYFELKTKIHAGSKTQTKQENTNQKIAPNYYYISEIVAGRPVLGYPLKKGGFRLRYGRSRMTGDGSWAISPITMAVLLDYIAIGTQLRVERPGKSTALTACDEIEGPILKLKDGSVVKPATEKEARKLAPKIEKILFLGDILISHGEFSENGHVLVPAGYCEEWWVMELEDALKNSTHKFDKELIEKIKANPIKTKITAVQALEFSKKLKVFLHPKYTHYWKEVSYENYLKIFNWFNKKDFENTSEIKEILEEIGCTHKIQENKIILEPETREIFQTLLSKKGQGENALEAINSTSEVKIRDKSGTYIGVRMGRPEKAKLRALKGTPNVLFPVGSEGGRLRSITEALSKKQITSVFPNFLCPKCNEKTIYPLCENCNVETKKLMRKSLRKDEEIFYSEQKIDIEKFFKNSRKRIHLEHVPDLIKGVRGTSNKNHFPEYLGKGLLRAKHKIPVNKDGTTRFDLTELGITHFKPKEIGLTPEKVRELGYEKDIHGNIITSDEQLIEIFPQDIILPKTMNKTEDFVDTGFFRVANFIDDELKYIYKTEPYYNLKKPEDLIGHLVIGLSPHTSAGIIGRILGFSSKHACFAHPYWHDAQRRDLDGEETSIILLMDAFLNFSRQYLPDRRGSRSMDAPLVLSIVLNPEEIDDEVYDLDTCWKYSRDFYEAALNYKPTSEVEVEQIRDRIGKEQQYVGMGFTHNVSSIDIGVRNSAYKEIPTMVEKLAGQMHLAKIIKAVDLAAVSKLVIEKHFIRDIKGNLRKFTYQKYRCTNCNTVYRRIPLSGKCERCPVKGNLVYTIAEGTVKKYLEATLKLIEIEGISPYLKQTISILKARIESIFGREKTKQTSLSGF